MTLSEMQKQKVVEIFATAGDENDFDKKIKSLGLGSARYEKEIANLIYAIATNKPVPKQK